jgi:hypothetical protein
VLCNHLHNAVGVVWDVNGCTRFGSLGIGVHWWSDCRRSGMVE